MLRCAPSSRPLICAITCSIIHTVAEGEQDTAFCVAAGTVDRADLRPGERVLDLASGTGICALDAALRVGPEGAVVGVDLTNTMLAVVRFSTVGAQGAAPYDAPCYGDMAVCQQRLCRLVCMIRLAAEILQCVLHQRVNVCAGCCLLSWRPPSRLSRIMNLRPQQNLLQARRKAELLGSRNVRFEVGDVDDLRLPAGSFDAALCSNGMIYFADTAGALRRISGWLRPGGRLVFNTPIVRTLQASTHLTQPHSPSVPAAVTQLHCCAGLCGTHDGCKVTCKATSVLNSSRQQK